MKDKILTSPFDLVIEALGCDKSSVTEESSMGTHPNWDSVNHINVIVTIEEKYEIQIPDEEVMKYDNMKAIIELYESLSKRS